MVIAAAQTEPWAELLQAGREDGRLVRQAYEGPRDAALVDVPEELHPELRAALRPPGWSGCTRIRPRRSRLRGTVR
jgi:DEAD/DEAH box helicase domain-containing protein